MSQTPVDMNGAIDLHCHPYPDLFPRLADDTEVVRHAQRQGFRAIQLKCHHESSVSRAYHVRAGVQGIEVFGGIVLNSYVGGINPAGVEAALRLGGKEVWMPTIDAAYHAEIHGGTGGYGVQQGGRTGGAGISILGEDGLLSEATLDVLELIAQHDAILGTCHLSPKEIVPLVTEARSRGVQRILITHPYFIVPNLDLETLLLLTGMGAFAEFGYCTVSPMWAYASVRKVAASIEAIGASRCVLVSDAGQRHNPLPAEALRVFAQIMLELGITQEQLDLMVKKNPAALLDLTSVSSDAPVPTSETPGDLG